MSKECLPCSCGLILDEAGFHSCEKCKRKPIRQGMAQDRCLVSAPRVYPSPKQTDQGGGEELGHWIVPERQIEAIEGRKVIGSEDYRGEQNRKPLLARHPPHECQNHQAKQRLLEHPSTS